MNDNNPMMENDEEKEQDRKKLILVIILAVALVAALVVGVVAIVNAVRGNDEPAETESGELLVPDYPPQATDPNQSPMEDDPGGTLETNEGGAGVNLTYTSVATADLSEGKVTLYYANPSKSTQDMVISLVVNGNVICRSQRITPGNQVTTLPIEESIRDVLVVGGYNAEYRVGCYDPDTGEKAVVELVGSGVVLTVVE